MSRKQSPHQPSHESSTPRQARSPASARSQDKTRALAAPSKSKQASARARQFPAKSPASPRAEWRGWPSLVVKLEGLPLGVTTEQLWDWFSPEGNVVWMEVLDTNIARGSVGAKVRFEPPPKRPFWAGGTIRLKHPDARKYPRDLTVSAAILKDAPQTFCIADNASHRREYPIRMTVGLRQLDFGGMAGPAAMRIMRTIIPSSPKTGDMELELDVRAKQLTVYFPVAAKTDNWQGMRQFCFRVDIPHVNKIYQPASEGGDDVVWVLPLPRPPQYFWKMDDLQSTFSSGAQTWSVQDLWYRATDIAEDINAPMRYPVALHNDIDDRGSIDIGRWTTFRLVLAGQPQGGNAETLRLLQTALEDFNVSVERCDDFRLQTHGKTMWDFLDHPPDVANSQASALLEMPACLVVPLPFEVRYQLEVCVSRGILNENTVTAEFLERLAALKPFDATRRLEFLADQNEVLLDPMRLFAHPDAESYIPSTRTPHYCTLVRKAVVTPTTIRYNTPTMETSNRVVRKYNHLQDRFLRVQFIEETEQGRISLNKTQNDEIWKRVLRTLYQGIRIGDRVYEFLGFGSSQLRQFGTYFFCPTEHTSCDDIRQWMGDFNHIRVVAKYAARLGQCFSTTREIRAIFQPKTRRIDDIERNGYCFTDGVGIVSQFLARLIIEEMTLDVLDEPTAFQFRMGGCKGVLTVWPQAKGMEVLVRESQEKFRAESNGLEIIRCAKMSTATLNRQIITILESLGVPVSAFEKLLDRQIREYQHAMTDNSVAIGLLTKLVDENQSTLILAELLRAGFKSSDIHEPFAMNLLNLWRSWFLKLLKEKARIQVAESAFVLGCVDETGTLRGHAKATEGSPDKDVDKLPQIFLQLTDPARYGETRIVKGICIVGRNPSLHPGDIRVVEAVDNANLHHVRDAVVFPSTGDRPVPNMLSGGDLDGDDFFVIWDQSLIPTVWNFPPMNYAGSQPLKLDRDVNVDDIRDFFVKYMKNDVLPLIATAHLAYADDIGPMAQRCLQLAELHSKAVDYPKTGDPAEFSARLQPRRWPYFMEKKHSYRSKKALGVIYDKVAKQTIQFSPDWEHAFDQRILSRFELDGETLRAAEKIKSQYDISVRRVLAQHDVATEFELYTSWAMSRPAVGTDYKRQEDLGREFDALKSRFRELCYEAAGGSDADKLDPFVAAMYRVTEREMKDALDEHHRGPTDEGGTEVPERPLEAKSMPLISFPWIFHWVMVRIATGGTGGSRKSLLAAARRKTQGVAASAPRYPAPEASSSDETASVLTSAADAASTVGFTSAGEEDGPGGAVPAPAALKDGAPPVVAGTGEDSKEPVREKDDSAAKQAAEGHGEGGLLVDIYSEAAVADETQGEANAMDRLAALMGFDAD